MINFNPFTNAFCVCPKLTNLYTVSTVKKKIINKPSSSAKDVMDELTEDEDELMDFDESVSDGGQDAADPSRDPSISSRDSSVSENTSRKACCPRIQCYIFYIHNLYYIFFLKHNLHLSVISVQ